MTGKDVLKKIATLLSIESKEVEFVDAKTREGAILQSPTFDVGEKVEVVSEDGTKSPAPDGEHEIALKDSEGKEVLIKIETKDGVITERENVELPSEEAVEEEQEMAKEDAEDVKAEPLPGDPSKVNDNTEEGLKFPPKVKPSSMMSSEVELENAEGPMGAHPESVGVEPIPSTEDKKMGMEELASLYETLSYRISELEKALKVDETSKDAEVSKEEDVKMEEEELPKLDGAPLEANTMFSTEAKKYGKKDASYQNSFLSKLYR